MSEKKTEVVEDTEDKKTASKLPKKKKEIGGTDGPEPCLLYTSPSPRDS